MPKLTRSRTLLNRQLTLRKRCGFEAFYQALFPMPELRHTAMSRIGEKQASKRVCASAESSSSTFFINTDLAKMLVQL